MDGKVVVDENLVDLEFRANSTEKGSFFYQRYDLMKKVWFYGHAYVVIMSALTVLSILTFQSSRPFWSFVYRMTFLGIVLTYGLALLQNLNGTEGNFYTLLPLHTFQYTFLAVLWLFTSKHLIKLAPYIVFSSLHVLQTITTEKSSDKQKELFKKADEEYAPKALLVIGYLELLFFLQLILDIFLGRRLSFVSFVSFSALYRIRVMVPGRSWDILSDVGNRLDTYITTKASPSMKEKWLRFKDKLSPSDLSTSDMHTEETDKAIDEANLVASLSR